MKNAKFLNVVLIIVFIIIASGSLAAQTEWIAKISGENNIEVIIREGDVQNFAESATIFQSLFPSPLGIRMPLTKDTLSYKKTIVEKMKNEKLKSSLIESYIDAQLFVIESERQNLYSPRKLDTKLDEFEAIAELQIISKLYIIQKLIPSVSADKDTIDKYFNELSRQFGASAPKNEIMNLASEYAIEEAATTKLKDEVEKIRNAKRIKYDSSDPFKVTINGEKEFTENELNIAYRGYLNLMFYVYKGGMEDDKELESLYKDADAKKTFVKEFINFHIAKQIVMKNGAFDEKQIKEITDKCTLYFKMNYINIRYAKEKILPQVEKRVTDENIESTVQAMLGNAKYAAELEGKDESYQKAYAERVLYQQLIMLLKQEEVKTLRDEYGIEYNY